MSSNLRPPLIGITTSLNEGEQRLDHAYVRSVEAAGGLPCIVPQLASEELSHAFADQLDGLIVTGGPAVIDGLIGVLPDDIDETDPIRVRSDKWILQHFLSSDKPILGICYGMQLINALLGGTIFADVENQCDGVTTHSRSRGGTTHEVAVSAGSSLAASLGTGRVVVNTRHVQAIRDCGKGLIVSARAPDGVVEAVENDDGRIVGVQFHPEQLPDVGPRLFRQFVDLAGLAAERRLQ